MLCLDVGMGSEEGHVRNWFGVKGEVIGIDIKENHKPEVVCDAQNLPFKDEVFDIITASEVLEHMHNPIQALHEWRRVLKTGKNIYITTPNGSWIAGVIQIMRKREKVSINPEHLNSWDCAHLKQLIEYCGFKVLEISYFTRDISGRKGLLPKLTYIFSFLAPSVMHSNIVIKAEKW